MGKASKPMNSCSTRTPPCLLETMRTSDANKHVHVLLALPIQTLNNLAVSDAGEMLLRLNYITREN